MHGSTVRSAEAPARNRSAAATVSAAGLAILLAAHGAVHGMGVALFWRLAESGELRYADTVPTPGTAPAYLLGTGWLIAGIALITAAVLLLTHPVWWRIAALVGALLSLMVISVNPAQAPVGLAVDGFVIALLLASWLIARRRRAG